MEKKGVDWNAFFHFFCHFFEVDTTSSSSSAMMDSPSDVFDSPTERVRDHYLEGMEVLTGCRVVVEKTGKIADTLFKVSRKKLSHL